MSWTRPASPKLNKANSYALAEALLILGVLCLLIVTATRILPLEAHPATSDRAGSPVSSALPLVP